jgi:hypothetical protein
LGEGSLGAVIFGSGGWTFFKRLGSKWLGRARTGCAGSNGGQLAGVGCVAAADFLGFGGAEFAVGRFSEQFEFLGIEFAEISGLLIEDQGAVTYAANLFDEMADLLEHFAQFAVAAFNENDFVPGVVALADLANAGWRGADLRRSGLAALDGNAAAESIELVLSGNPGNLDEVSLLHACGGAGEAVGELAVVGHQQQAFAHVVEAADRVEALAHLVKELHDRGAAFRVLDGGDEALGLVQDEVAKALGALQELAVDADVVAAGVSFGAQLSNDLAVDLDSALLDKLLGFAAAGYAGLGEDFLQAVELGGGTGLEFRLVFRLVFGFGLRAVFRLRLRVVF